MSLSDISGALKASVQKGADVAVSELGVENALLNNDKGKIALPGLLNKALPILKMTGKDQQLDDLLVSMNHAAKAAVPLAKTLLMNVNKSVSVTDAKNIPKGSDTSVTDFSKQKTSVDLGQKFLPIVKVVTDRNGLSAQYNPITGQLGKSGIVPAQQSTVEGYVRQRALDGLYTIIGHEEKPIRKNPIGAVACRARSSMYRQCGPAIFSGRITPK